jgi:hypothetical protein
MPYIQIGNKVVETDEKGNIKCTSKQIEHPDGRIDCEIHIPCLMIKSKTNEKEK